MSVAAAPESGYEKLARKMGFCDSCTLPEAMIADMERRGKDVPAKAYEHLAAVAIGIPCKGLPADGHCPALHAQQVAPARSVEQ